MFACFLIADRQALLDLGKLLLLALTADESADKGVQWLSLTSFWHGVGLYLTRFSWARIAA